MAFRSLSYVAFTAGLVGLLSCQTGEKFETASTAEAGPFSAPSARAPSSERVTIREGVPVDIPFGAAGFEQVVDFPLRTIQKWTEESKFAVDCEAKEAKAEPRDCAIADRACPAGGKSELWSQFYSAGREDRVRILAFYSEGDQVLMGLGKTSGDRMKNASLIVEKIASNRGVKPKRWNEFVDLVQSVDALDDETKFKLTYKHRDGNARLLGYGLNGCENRVLKCSVAPIGQEERCYQSYVVPRYQVVETFSRKVKVKIVPVKMQKIETDVLSLAASGTNDKAIEIKANGMYGDYIEMGTSNAGDVPAVEYGSKTGRKKAALPAEAVDRAVSTEVTGTGVTRAVKIKISDKYWSRAEDPKSQFVVDIEGWGCNGGWWNMCKVWPLTGTENLKNISVPMTSQQIDVPIDLSSLRGKTLFGVTVKVTVKGSEFYSDTSGVSVAFPRFK